MRRSSVLSPPSTPLLPIPSYRRKNPPSKTTCFILSRRAPLASLPCRSRPILVFPSLCSSRSAIVVADSVLESRNKGGDGENQESNFVEVGYISSAHGLKGEVRVIPTTEFPELRFSQPGRRWLKTRISGREHISEVELTGGRGHPGQKSWIVSFRGIDTVDKAKQMVGSNILVLSGDRPELEEGEFYTSDLVGMRVILKETGRIVGTVANVFNHGASDLLQVVLDSNNNGECQPGLSKTDANYNGQHIWIPFVETIVPDVDMERKEMHITPPKGLLELNLRSDLTTKKERRLLEWKERKKFQQRLLAAKRKLAEMGQKHILEGLSFGEKAKKSLFSEQVVSIDLKLFEHAFQSINRPLYRDSFWETISTTTSELSKNAIRLTPEYFISCATKGKEDPNFMKYKIGQELLQERKGALVLVVDGDRLGKVPKTIEGGSTYLLNQFQELLLACNNYLKVDDQDQRIEVPLIVVSSANEIQLYKEALSAHDYFGFDSQKVWILEEQKLPIVSTSVDENSNKILLMSPWELHQAPIGSGGLFNLLSSHRIIEDLAEMGIEYIQVSSLSERSILGHPLFFGLVSSAGADLGVKTLESNSRKDEFDMIFSMCHVQKIAKRFDKVHFSAVPEQHVHVNKVNNEWLTVHPDDKPNSYRFHSSIYSFLDSVSLETMYIMEVSG